MAATKRIAVGLPVSIKHGPLVANKSDEKQRIRDLAYKAVIRAT